jgi:5-methyltetrahydrofolate--homocysteine methyltransferase
MNLHTQPSKYLDLLHQRVVVFDGAMGTNLQKMHLTLQDYGGERHFGFHDILVLTAPHAVESIHRSFLEVGVDVIETNTFRANRITLQEVGLSDQVIEINCAAAQLARRVADEFSTPQHSRFVAGSLGPTGHLLSSTNPELCKYTFSEISEVYAQQVLALMEGGVDLLLIETAQDILEVRAAILGIQQAFVQFGKKLPIQAQVTLDTHGRMLLGTDIGAVLASLQGMAIDVLGINCSTGPEHMLAPIQYLSQHSPLPVSCLPNAGIPGNQDGEAVYPLQPDDFAAQMSQFVEHFGVNVVGGCCGTTPRHLQLLVEKIKDLPPRKWATPPRALLSSSLHAVELHQEPPPLIIGERLNTQGSRQFRQVVLNRSWQEALQIANQQVASGAHALDLCVALTERADEAETMRTLVHLLSANVDMPLVIDATDPQVMEAALQAASGRCLLNSAHLEGGTARAETVFTLAKKYHAAVICLTIDESGMAQTAARKLEIARRIHDLAVQRCGLLPQDLVFDPLTFTLATGDEDTINSALETLEGIRLIKANLPGTFTSLGVSNCSYGLQTSARGVINSVFLYHAVQAGLDIAILNPALITPYPAIPPQQRALAEDLIFNRKPDAVQRLVEYFQNQQHPLLKRDTEQTRKAHSPAERIRHCILEHSREGLSDSLDKLIHKKSGSPSENALKVLNDHLLPAMQEVGELFARGELILPFVLQSAEVMKAAVTHLEGYLSHEQSARKGRIVLATVYGDVHDIGKNLVNTILSNNGYQVIDLGKGVPAEQIIETAIEQKADAIGLSALLVSTSQQMAHIVAELHRRGLAFPVLVGGAAINAEFAQRIAQSSTHAPYPGGVTYCRDAFDALAALQIILKKRTKSSPLHHHVFAISDRTNQDKIFQDTSSTTPVQSAPIPRPPFWGSRVLEEIPLDGVLSSLNRKALFRLGWGARNARGEKWLALTAEFEDRLDRMLSEWSADPWFQLKAAYGYWPVRSQDNGVLVYDPLHLENETPIARFIFPRQPSAQRLCLADYFAPLGSAQKDILTIQVVTVGQQAIDHIQKLYHGSNFSEGYYAHGLAAQFTEALAAYVHAFIKHELGLPQTRSKRYSWGFPALPDLSQHEVVFSLLPARQSLGMSLTSAWQLIPELSTAALIVHHPAARYFSIQDV